VKHTKIIYKCKGAMATRRFK